MSNEPLTMIINDEPQLDVDATRDTTSPAEPTPLNIKEERKLYADLVAFLHAHKDADTVIEAVAPDDYVDGLD